MSSSEWHESVGAIHLHSDFSDGSLSIPEIAQIAEGKGLDFLMFSDHNTLAPKRLGLEGWYGRVLVLIGCELNDPNDRNHYLAYRITEEIPQGLEAEAYVRRVREAGGFGVIAHPAERRRFSEAYPPYPWTAWEAEGFDGIEIWNQLSEWIEGVRWTNILWRIWHPLRSIRYPVWETLARWDALNRTRRVIGIGGIDVHAHRVRLFGPFSFEVYPYKVQFRSIRTHLLTETPLRGEDPWHPSPFSEAEKRVFESLQAGRCFVVNSAVGEGRGFRFFAESLEGRWPMGARLPEGPSYLFTAETPAEARIRLLKDGCEAVSLTGRSIAYASDEPGVYRIEAFRKGRGWIYSNPIVIETEKSIKRDGLLHGKTDTTSSFALGHGTGG